MTPTPEQMLQVMGEETMQKLVAAEKRIAELEATLRTLIDANEGNLSDVDGVLYEARKVLGP